jgi:hypothetical protein
MHAMNTPSSRQRLVARVVAGVAGSFVLSGLLSDVRAGFFNFHGEAFRRVEHPIGFWLWAAFVTASCLSVLYWSALGTFEGPKD